MQSLLNEKKKLYDTLLSFPPFFTSYSLNSDFKIMHNQEKNK